MIAKRGRRRGASTTEHRGAEEVSPSSQNSEHDICYTHPQKGAQARTQGRLRDRASRPKILSMVFMPDHVRSSGSSDQYPSSRVSRASPRPIIDGFHLTRVLMDGGSSLNLLYQDTVRKMGINPSRIKPTKTTFKGVIPGVEARYTGSITLEVVFGSPDNF